MDEVRAWVGEERALARTHGPTRTTTDEHGQGEAGASSVPVRGGPCESVARPGSSTLVANAALALLNLACRLLDRQLAAQAGAFEAEGGFTERLHRVRSARRKENP